MNINDQLKELNLTRSEIKVYLYLLENGLSSPPQVAHGTAIARTNCYNILAKLQNEGLIKEQEKSKRKAYIADDPQALLRSIQKKQEAIERLLPDLRALYTIQKNKPKIRFYDGFEQVKEIYWQATNTDKLLALGSTKHLMDRDPVFFRKFEQALKVNNIFLQDLITQPSEKVGIDETKNILRGMYDFKLLPEKYSDFPTDIMIWSDNIALITLADPVFGTVITNQLLAQTFRFIFEMIREGIAN
jgi:predicted transcriptional regulator